MSISFCSHVTLLIISRRIFGRIFLHGHFPTLQPLDSITYLGKQFPNTGPVLFCLQLLFLPQAPTEHLKTLALPASLHVLVRRVADTADRRRAQKSSSPPPGSLMQVIVASFQAEKRVHPWSGKRHVSFSMRQSVPCKYSNVSSQGTLLKRQYPSIASTIFPPLQLALGSHVLQWTPVVLRYAFSRRYVLILQGVHASASGKSSSRTRVWPKNR